METQEVTTTEAPDAQDIDQRQNGDVIIGPQPDPSMTVQNAKMEEDKARSEATFRYTVQQFSELKDAIFSPACYVGNLPWKIMVMQSSSHKQDRTAQPSLGFFLKCNGESESSSWCCYAFAELRLLSVWPYVKTFSRSIRHLFHSKEDYYGFSDFVGWNDVSNPEKGYIKDDAVTLEVRVVVPHRVSCDSKKHTALRQKVEKSARIGRVTNNHFVKLTTVSGTETSTQNHSTNCCIPSEKNLLVRSRKNKGMFGFTKNRTGAAKTPTFNMNHVTVQYRCSNDNPPVGEVEKMKTQEVTTTKAPDAQDMDQTQICNVIIGPQPGPSMTVQNAEMEEDKARSEATFRYTVQQFSKLKDSVFSPACYVRNVPWKIMVTSKSINEQDGTAQRFLGFFLKCNGESKSSSWSCFAIAEFRLLSVRPDVEPFSRKTHHLFCPDEDDWGFWYFMAWNDVLDPEKGYIKDDAITLEVHVAADALHGVSCDSKKHTGV